MNADPSDRVSGKSEPAALPVELGRLVVNAGRVDRDHSVVTFPLTLDAAPALVLRSEQGHTFPLERDAHGRGTFVLDALHAGREAVLAIERVPIETAGPDVVEQGRRLELRTSGRVVAHFQLQGELPPGVDPVYLRGGYLHPLHTPGGVEVTGDYPESHHHQHGIWSAWTRTRFRDRPIDFWNMAERQGKVDLEALEHIRRGPVSAGFRARLAHVDLVGAEPATALGEHWTVTTYQTHRDPPPYFLLDLDSTQWAATDEPLLLERYVYGGFGLRGHAQWEDPGGVTFATSEGLDRATGDNAKARWCAMAGLVDGVWAGFAVLGHPENFRAPQALRIHPKHPYVAFAPIKEGSFTIEPGQPYRTRFRIVSFDGPIDREGIERLWQDYANPVKARVE